MKLVFIFTILSGLDIVLTTSLSNGQAWKPPMGWLPRQRFNCLTDCDKYPDECVSSKLYLAMANRLLQDDYEKLGYTELTIDICQDREGVSRFTATEVSEIKNEIRSLKLGIYGSIDAENAKNNVLEQTKRWLLRSYRLTAESSDYRTAALRSTEIFNFLEEAKYNVMIGCEWPRIQSQPPSEISRLKDSCNLMRFAPDIRDDWLSVLSIIDNVTSIQDSIIETHGPGNWFDPGHLLIGNFALSLEQAKTQMAIWSMWSAPLFMSNDLREIDQDMKNVLQNRALIKINQDHLGVLGKMVGQKDQGTVHAFVKPINEIVNSCPSFVIAYTSRDLLGNKKKVSYNVRTLLLKARNSIEVAASRARINGKECLRRITEESVNYDVIDLLNNNEKIDTVDLNSNLNLHVKPSGVRVVKLTESDFTRQIDE